MRTRARRRGSDWVLDGAKHWITNGALADVAVVWAATDDGIKAFLVEKGTSGFRARVIKNKLSLRASSTAELELADVSVSDSARLPEANGLKAALRCLDEARFGIAWGACGAARGCIDTVLSYTQSRELFGRPLNQTQLIQTRLADAVRKLTGAQLIAWRLAKLKELGRRPPRAISLAKWNNVRAALDIARDCRDMLGAAGMTLDHSPDAAYVESRDRHHLRGNREHPRAHRGSRADGAGRVLMGQLAAPMLNCARFGLGGRVVMQRPAKPCTAVRFRS